MSDYKDMATSVLKVTTDILFVRNPVGTSMGALFGIVMHAIVNLFYPILQGITVIKITALNVFHYIAIGIFGFNIKHFKNYHKVSPHIEEAIIFIEKQRKKGNITKLEAKQRYRELISKVVENARLDKDTKDIINIVRSVK